MQLITIDNKDFTGKHIKTFMYMWISTMCSHLANYIMLGFMKDTQIMIINTGTFGVHKDGLN